MDVVLPTPGSYVVAVSGGVDSIALLHMLQKSNIHGRRRKLIVAHLDHGIRPDSAEDRKLVQETARWHGLPFVYHESRLGPAASEAAAREARYGFLRKVQEAAGARAIITAHHQDDVLETAVINILRGSGRKGLTSLGSRPGLLRPLLDSPKSDLVAYARDQGLLWREDSTNRDETYLRNYVRHRLLPKLAPAGRSQLLDLIRSLGKTNREIDALLAEQLLMQPVSGTLDRYWFGHLPHPVAQETLAAWLRSRGIRSFDKKTLERLVIAAKVAPAGKTFPIQKGLSMRVYTDRLALDMPER